MSAADLIFHGGTVRTMAGDGPVSDAIAVRGGEIVAVGDDQVRPLLGSRTDLVDLRGGALLPGFQDAHVHPVAGGLQRMECDLSHLHSLEDYLVAIHTYAMSHPDSEWITGAGWYGDVFPGGFPSRADFDRATGDRPGLLTSHDGHGAWANTAALRRAGISKDSSDPVDGKMLREPDGEPTGMLIEGAVDLVARLVPPPGEARLQRAILQAQRYLHGLGITAWQDAAVGEALGLPDTFGAYASLAGHGRLTARVVGALWWRREDGVDQIAELTSRRSAAADAHFRATAVKIMQDGVCENLTAALLAGYRGRPDEHGMSFLQPAELQNAAVGLDAAGFDVHFHAVGDRAVRDCLDAVSALKRGQGTDSRHQIAHIDLIDPGDIPRMSKLGVIANIQPLWARNDPVLVDTKLPYLTDQQRQQHFAFGSLVAEGVRIAMGSDWPVSSPNPLWGIHSAVNRTAPPNDPHARDHRSQRDPLLLAEAVTAEQACAAYTVGAAHANHLDPLTGTIAPGKAADLVLLDRDPVTVAPNEIAGVTVTMTIASGHVVHESEESP